MTHNQSSAETREVRALREIRRFTETMALSRAETMIAMIKVVVDRTLAPPDDSNANLAIPCPICTSEGFKGSDCDHTVLEREGKS